LRIVKDFGYSVEKDRESAILMHELGKDRLMESSILTFLRNKKVMVVGNSPDVCDELESIDYTPYVVIVAGKAIESVQDLAKVNILVTDMDEKPRHILEMEQKGCLLVLHAHGDNMDRQKKVIPEVNRFVGTTQTEPFDRIYNFGGFTDGDRAAIMAQHFKAKEIRLVGFDFHKADNEIKKRKLMWAERLLRDSGILV